MCFTFERPDKGQTANQREAVKTSRHARGAPEPASTFALRLLERSRLRCERDQRTLVQMEATTIKSRPFGRDRTTTE